MLSDHCFPSSLVTQDDRQADEGFFVCSSSPLQYEIALTRSSYRIVVNRLSKIYVPPCTSICYPPSNLLSLDCLVIALPVTL